MGWLLLLLIEELSKRFSEEIVDFPVTEEQVVLVQQFQLLFVVSEVFLSPVVADALAQERKIEVFNFLGEIGLRVKGKDGETGVVFLTVDGMR